ncbi:uncharacterized protein CEXT_228631 [Caerostris extrusa]|uniref:Uncharacterized protein n=1 Tax=Caerostris extrusa TaxID=172846 RepID=A0AAV4MJX3_CAEEX|nr:uncharacterized protein CEXT_228631 [Caerostris extrusa]
MQRRRKRGVESFGQELEIHEIEAGIEHSQAGRKAAAATGTPATTGVHQKEDDAHLAADLELVANRLRVGVLATQAEPPLHSAERDTSG